MLCYDLYRAEACTLITNKMRKCKPALFRKKTMSGLCPFLCFIASTHVIFIFWKNVLNSIMQPKWLSKNTSRWGFYLLQALFHHSSYSHNLEWHFKSSFNFTWLPRCYRLKTKLIVCHWVLFYKNVENKMSSCISQNNFCKHSENFPLHSLLDVDVQTSREYCILYMYAK